MDFPPLRNPNDRDSLSGRGKLHADSERWHICICIIFLGGGCPPTLWTLVPPPLLCTMDEFMSTCDKLSCPRSYRRCFLWNDRHFLSKTWHSVNLYRDADWETIINSSGQVLFISYSGSQEHRMSQLLTTCTALDYNLPFCPRFEKKYLRKLSAVALSALDQWL